MVFGLMAFFHVIKATFLVYFSIPTVLVYVIGYILIYKEKLYGYVVMVYCWLTLYMGVTTICLGYGYGFHLYCMSMIPIIFYTGYMARSIDGKPIHAIVASVVIVAFYLATTLIPTFRGPIYTSDTGADTLFWIVNSIIVFSFLIFYTYVMIKGITDSEDKLKALAMKDNLTGLYNRHYILKQLETTSGKNDEYFVAMADIDDFKKVNDTYGHNAGDYILKTVAEIMREACDNVLVSRWGGEEFLIILPNCNGDNAFVALERVRRTIQKSVVKVGDKEIKVTMTFGLTEFGFHQDIDKVIKEADEKLYYGKSNGRNQVVY